MMESEQQHNDERLPFIHLDRLFLYQNNVTGQVSSTHLTLRQLCRILCPTTQTLSQQIPTIRHLTSDTNLLLQELDGSYGEWHPAHSIPVLQEILSWWYYYVSPTTHPNSSSARDEMSMTETFPSTEKTKLEVSPPVSCRTLALVVRNHLQEHSTATLYFSSILTDSTWKTLSQLPNLKMAIEAFYDSALDNSEPSLTSTLPTTYPDLRPVTEDDHPHNDSSDIQQELEAFLNSTNPHKRKNINHDDDENEECYESDGGSRYIKDHRNGNWVHEALVLSSSLTVNKNDLRLPETENPNSKNDVANSEAAKKPLRKKAKFAAKNMRCWIYVSGLPTDCTEKEIAERFSKAGLLDLDPKTQLPKIKLYRYKKEDVDVATNMLGQPKGDASICYARPESVSLAVTLFDGTPLRISTIPKNSDDSNNPFMSVQAAKFEQHGTEFDSRRSQHTISNAQRKIAKLATKQAMDWDEGEYNGRLTGGRKGLRIIVLKHSFDPTELKDTSDVEQDAFFGKLEEELRMGCEQCGAVEKITFFASNPEGITVVKFTQPGSASDAVFKFNGSLWKGRTIEASFWDGVSDYTVKDETKEANDLAKREEEFGEWLESQDLPDEFRLQTE